MTDTKKSPRFTWGGKGVNIAIIVCVVLTVTGIALGVVALRGLVLLLGLKYLPLRPVEEQ